MKVRLYICLALLLLVALSYGCGGSAELEMKDAQLAMKQASEVRAEELAPTDFEQAQKAWDRGQAADKEGKTDTAKVLYTSAKIYAGKAKEIADAKRGAMVRELDSMQLVIDNNLSQVKSDIALNNISSGKLAKVKAISSEVEEDNTSIRKLVQQNDLRKAVALAKEVQTKIYKAQLILAGQ